MSVVEKSSVMVEPNHSPLESVNALDRIFPRLMGYSRQSGDNAIIQKHVIIYARQGRGKSNTARWIVEEARRRFKEENVNVQVAKGEDFRKMINSGCWTHQLVQILVLEDITNVEFSDADLRDFFRIREVMAKQCNRLDGLVLVIFTVHRFYDTPKSFRSDYDGLFALSAPSNDYDYDFLERKFGEEDMKYLSQADDAQIPEGKALFLYRRADKQRIQIPKIDAVNSFMVQMDHWWKTQVEASEPQEVTPIKKVKEEKAEERARIFTLKPSTEPTKHDNLKLSGFLALFATLVFMFASRPLGVVPLIIMPLGYATSVFLAFREVKRWIKAKWRS